jgi:hypothetical protein
MVHAKMDTIIKVMKMIAFSTSFEINFVEVAIIATTCNSMFHTSGDTNEKSFLHEPKQI